MTFPTINAPNEAVAKPEKLIPCCFNINIFVNAMTLKTTNKILLVAAPVETHVSLFSITSLFGKILYSLVGVTNLRLAVGAFASLTSFREEECQLQPGAPVLRTIFRRVNPIPDDAANLDNLRTDLQQLVHSKVNRH
jgi:hypothetical protein